jgi:hypothetical protein
VLYDRGIDSAEKRRELETEEMIYYFLYYLMKERKEIVARPMTSAPTLRKITYLFGVPKEKKFITKTG